MQGVVIFYGQANPLADSLCYLNKMVYIQHYPTILAVSVLKVDICHADISGYSLLSDPPTCD